MSLFDDILRWSLLRFRHILSFFFHLLNHRRDRKTPVELAYPNFNIQARQVKALPASILVVEPISSRTRENLDALKFALKLLMRVLRILRLCRRLREKSVPLSCSG